MAEALDWQGGVDPARTALFLDVDGTLLGFKERPQDVVADDELRAALGTLRDRTGGALALISGRMIEDLDRIMAPLVLAAGGTHGADMRWPDGRREAMDAAALAQVRPLARAFVDAREGLVLEDKGAALAVHFRRVPTREAEVGRFLEDTVAGLDLMVQHGKMVAEVKSKRSSKGSAITTFMETAPFAGRVPLFIGDDLTDEHGFESVNALGGVSIKVGHEHEPTIARHRLAGVSNVRSFLNTLCLSISKIGRAS